jgi:transposase
LRAAEQERADVARARRRWMRVQGLFDPARLVFIDETSANTKMLRLYGRCARGERLVGHVPQGHWKTITLVAAPRRHGMRASRTIDGAMTGKKFLAYVEQCLAPTLKRRISSRSTIFRRTRLSACARRSKRAARRFAICPKYSPDLNPIEMSFSKLKAHLRKTAERTRCIGRFVRSLPAKLLIISGMQAVRGRL